MFYVVRMSFNVCCVVILITMEAITVGPLFSSPSALSYRLLTVPRRCLNFDRSMRWSVVSN